MKIAIGAFKGQIPRLHPRLLPQGFAQTAINARLTDGSLTPYRNTDLAHDFGTVVQTIYKHQGAWLGYNNEVDLVPGPIAQDRIYYTGDGVPKVTTGAGVIYALALPKPTSTPTLSVASGTLNTALQEDILYCSTFLTSLDEESAPSPMSAAIAWSPGMVIRLTFADAGTMPTGRAINRRRIYRSQTSRSGVTDLYFVAEIAVGTGSGTYDHNIATNPMAEVLPSLDFDTPPDNMQGLTELPGGMMAAFVGRELLFSEPFQPHAWPIKYRLKTNYPIVGLCAFGSTLAILTEGTPYIAQGTAPENMSMERMESNLPCVSSRSIVDLGYAAAYASNDGLVLITPSSTQIVTRSLYTREEWQRLLPETIFAASLEGKYAFAHTAGSVMVLDGGTPAAPSPPLYDPGGPPAQPNAVILDHGNPLTTGALRSIGLIDLTGEQPFFVDVELDFADTPTGLYYETSENILYIIDAGTKAKAFDNPTSRALPLRWRSAKFVLNSLENFGAIWVQTDRGPSESNTLTTRVIVNGALASTTHGFGAPERLPAGLLASEWEVEVQGVATVTGIILAGSIEECMT